MLWFSSLRGQKYLNLFSGQKFINSAPEAEYVSIHVNATKKLNVCTCFELNRLVGMGLKCDLTDLEKALLLVPGGQVSASPRLKSQCMYKQQQRLQACTVMYMYLSAFHPVFKLRWLVGLIFLPSSSPVITPGRHWNVWNGYKNRSSSTCRCVPVEEKK